MKTVATIDHPVRVVDGKSFLVQQLVWADGRSSFDVSLLDVEKFNAGEPTYEYDLTPDESLDEMPSDEQLLGLHAQWQEG